MQQSQGYPYSLFAQSYLEDFYKFCEELGGATANVMCEALAVSNPIQTDSPKRSQNKVTNETVTWLHSCTQFEADRRAFIITINSFGTDLAKDDVVKLYPTCGKLSPGGLERLSNCDDQEQVRALAEHYAVGTCSFSDDFISLFKLNFF